MPNGYEVVADELRAHAGKADGHAQQVAQALDAANQAMPDDAYGIICQFLPPLVNSLELQARDALTASQEGLRAISGKLRDSADSYENQEGMTKAAFSGIDGPVR